MKKAYTKPLIYGEEWNSGKVFSNSDTFQQKMEPLVKKFRDERMTDNAGESRVYHERNSK